ncbi:MAG TPA: hypothetical protein VLS52_08535, partial [Rudaea sp.]|nr:hypothetical protein [Rudaea sp.]
AAASIPQHPVYFESGQYSAVFAQGALRWRLQPLAGDVVDVVDRACASDLRLPRGVWLVTRDDADRLQLVAPSTTELPPDFPEQLRLVACGSGEERGAFGVPDIVLTWLAGNSGSVMINE